MKEELKVLMINKSLNFKTMLSYRLKSRKIQKVKTKRIMLISKFAVHDSKKAKFIQEQEARGLLIK